jgi:sulfite reductase alpha subunit-like flavoprotein
MPFVPQVMDVLANRGGHLLLCGASRCVDGLDTVITSLFVEHMSLTKDKATDLKIQWKASGKLKVESFGA